MTTTDLLADHVASDTQDERVGEDPNSATNGHRLFDTHAAHAAGDGPKPRNGHDQRGTQVAFAVAAQTPPDPATNGPVSIASAPGPVAQAPEPTNVGASTIEASSVRAPSSPAAISHPVPIGSAPPGNPDRAIDQAPVDTQQEYVDGAPNCPLGPAIAVATPIPPAPVLVDSTLMILATQVGDLEGFREALGSRLEILTRVGADKDGKHRGWGLHPDEPVVIQQAEGVASIKAMEDRAVKELKKHLKKSPLGPYVLSRKGIGFKTIARLLAATGDPYWNDLYDRPRTVSELWSYCGYGDASAQRKRKNQRISWSPEARVRGHNCADPVKRQIRKPCYALYENKKQVGAVHFEGSCECSPYRVLFDEVKARYIGSVHHEECNQCTEPGKPPAPIGSPRKASHIDAIALRAVVKQLLKDLWHEAKRLHELAGDHCLAGTHLRRVASDPALSGSHRTIDTQRRDAAGETNFEAEPC